MFKGLVTAVLIILSLHAFGQKKVPKRPLVAIDTTMLYDLYVGPLPAQGILIRTKLRLNHLRYADDGKFVLLEMYRNAAGRDTIAVTKGDWTVLRGNAKDENATVVELTTPAGTLNFLRRKDGDLQKLDASLKEIKPVNSYILKKK